MKINWDSEVLSSVSKAVDQLEYLSINKDSIESVADWLAYEEFPFPSNPTSVSYTHLRAHETLR